MAPHPDPRWEKVSETTATATETGRPITFADLEDLASGWSQCLPASMVPGAGALALLRTARSLFIHSWFDYEFMVVASLVSFQAVEAAFRELYGDRPGTKFRTLVDRAERDGILPHDIAELVASGAQLRNLLSHPEAQVEFTIELATLTLEATHGLVAGVIARITAAVAPAAPARASIAIARSRLAPSHPRG
jgi:hypothetical protein